MTGQRLKYSKTNFKPTPRGYTERVYNLALEQWFAMDSYDVDPALKQLVL